MKQEFCHFDEIFICGCTGICYFDKFRCRQWWRFQCCNFDEIFIAGCTESCQNYTWCRITRVILFYIRGLGLVTLLFFRDSHTSHWMNTLPSFRQLTEGTSWYPSHLLTCFHCIQYLSHQELKSAQLTNIISVTVFAPEIFLSFKKNCMSHTWHPSNYRAANRYWISVFC